MPNTSNQAMQHTIPRLYILPEVAESRIIATHLLDEWLSDHSVPADKTYQLADLDLIHAPAESETLKIEAVRELKTTISFSVPGNRYRHVFLHDLHTASEAAQQALLKTLEDGMPQTQWWLTTKNQQAVLTTIQSRCELVRLPPSILTKHINTTTGALSEHPHFATLSEVLSNLEQLSFGQLTDAAQPFTKKEDARQAINLGIQILHEQKNAQPEQASAISALSHSLQALTHLEANVSPRLAIEHWLFKLKQAGYSGSNRAAK